MYTTPFHVDTGLHVISKLYSFIFIIAVTLLVHEGTNGVGAWFLHMFLCLASSVSAPQQVAALRPAALPKVASRVKAEQEQANANTTTDRLNTCRAQHKPKDKQADMYAQIPKTISFPYWNINALPFSLFPLALDKGSEIESAKGRKEL